MKILKTETPHFEFYSVIAQRTKTVPALLRGIKKLIFYFANQNYPTIEAQEEIVLDNVLEADDATGYLMQQIFDQNGYAVYTNGDDEIVIDNVVKLLLLTPSIKQAFLMAGFRPKVQITHEKNFRIVNTLADKVPNVPVPFEVRG
jgi:hypothetical protein